MHLIRINGGLGNQLFQYAFGRSVAELNNKKVKFDVFDLLNNKGVTPREFHLQKLFSNFEVASLKQRKFYLTNKKLKYKSFNFLFPHINNERSFRFDEQNLRPHRNTYFEGYWQSPKYFSSIYNSLLSEMNLELNKKDEAKLGAILDNVENSACLHLRRGDYLKLQNLYRIIELPYYTNAIQILADKYHVNKFIVFTDDYENTRSLFDNQKYLIEFIYTYHLDDLTEFKLMTKFKYFIISNSSFSWWSAYLSNWKDKKVIAPKKWYVEEEKFPTEDLLPKDWICL